MQDYSASFYSSRPWQDTRRAYRKSVGGLCEVCLKNGIYKPGEIVHHKIPIDPTNINNPDITLNWDNLMYVCRDCHAKIHDRKNRRYKVDEMGRVTAWDG